MSGNNDHNSAINEQQILKNYLVKWFWQTHQTKVKVQVVLVA